MDPAGTTADLTTRTIGIEYGFPATSSFDVDSAAQHKIPAVSTVTVPPPQATLDPPTPYHRRRCHRPPRATTPAGLRIAPAPGPCASAGFPAAPPRDAAGAAPPPVVQLPTVSACDHARRTCHRPRASPAIEKTSAVALLCHRLRFGQKGERARTPRGCGLTDDWLDSLEKPLWQACLGGWRYGMVPRFSRRIHGGAAVAQW